MMTKDGLIFEANSLKQGRLQALTRQQLQAQATQNRERRWVAGYLLDLARARRGVDQHIEGRSPAIGLRCRYALMTTSLNSLAGNIPPALLAALVESNMWLPSQGLAYARQVPEAAQRVQALTALLTAQLTPLERNQILGAALEAARAIGDEW